PPRPTSPPPARRSGRWASPTSSWRTTWICAGPPGRRPRSSWGSRPAAVPPCCTRPRPGPGWPGATSSRPTMSRRWRSRRCGTGSGCGTRPSWKGPHRIRCWRPSCSPSPPRAEAARMVTSRVPLLLTGLALPGLVTPWPWLWLGGAALVTAVLTGVDAALAAPLSGLRLSRTGDRQVRFGGTATVRLRVGNRSTRPLRARVRDAWVPSAGAVSEPPAPQMLEIDPGTAVEVVTRLTPTRRGDRPAALVTVRSYGPRGLAYRPTTRRRPRQLTPPWRLRTLPPFTSRRFLPEKLARLRVIEGQTAIRGRGQGTEFDSLREYVVGDDIRSIDWRATARAEHVVVKNWRP